MEVFVVMVKGTVTVFLSGDDAVQYADECLLEYEVGDTKLIKCEVKLPKAKLGQALSYWCQEIGVQAADKQAYEVKVVLLEQQLKLKDDVIAVQEKRIDDLKDEINHYNRKPKKQ